MSRIHQNDMIICPGTGATQCGQGPISGHVYRHDATPDSAFKKFPASIGSIHQYFPTRWAFGVPRGATKIPCFRRDNGDKPPGCRVLGRFLG